MTMIPMVLSGDIPVVEVRHDVIENSVACVVCKGRGFVSRHICGNLWHDGIAVFRSYRCYECNGRGTWQED